MRWSVRDLLNPVITRCLLYGTNPFDLERVVKAVEKIEIISGKAIKNTWLDEWDKKSVYYANLAEKSENTNNTISAREYYRLASQCCYSAYMVNTDDISQKRKAYKSLEKYYKKSVSYRDNKVSEVLVPVDNEKMMPGYLHFPDNNGQGKYPCVILFAGIGSCKEELDMLANPLVERGMAVLACDMAGTGSALFDYDLKCNADDLEKSFDALYNFAVENENIDEKKLASYGLCMGGGFAFRAAAKHSDIKCCVSMFPLFMNLSELDSIPIWMKRGKWAAFQHGEISSDEFLDKMKTIEHGSVKGDYMLVYSADDNWMSTDASMSLYNRASGYKDKILINEKPVFVSDESIMHAMPVGEQLHWVKPQVSDWIAERLKAGDDIE